MKGKEKCRILKEIRQQIAEQNHITFVTSECKHKGDCTGTCPKCEQELRYLEKELEKRKSAGKAVAVAGIAAALMVSAAGCGDPSVQPPATEGSSQVSECTVTAGVPDTEYTYTEMMGAPTEPELPTEDTTQESTEIFIMGDVAYEESAP